MLCRVSCKACNISCLWTDDPQGFLGSVCLRYRHCQAKLIDEDFAQPLAARRPKAAPPNRMAVGKVAVARAQGRHSAAH